MATFMLIIHNPERIRHGRGIALKRLPKAGVQAQSQIVQSSLILGVRY